ncbi:MAG: hypothetical protein P1U90_21975 [Akkermansiaceae bacterium]|nr:hypothetical protein [Akkermansiaceae bacterium]
MLRKFLPLFITAVIALLVAIALVVASPFFQDDEAFVAEKDLEEEGKVVLSSVEEKLNEIVIPEVRFDNVSVEEAIEFLRLRSIECDRSGVDDSQKGIGFILRGPKVISGDDGHDELDGFWDAADPNAYSIKFLSMANARLIAVLDVMCSEAKLKWEIDPDSHKIVITPLDEDHVEKPETPVVGGPQDPFQQKSELQSPGC